MKTTHQNDFRRTVEWAGQEFALMFLPMFSLSNPDQAGLQRMVFDWGKSLPHPDARIAIAILADSEGQFIRTVVIDDVSYTVQHVKKCRSGRCAARVKKVGPVHPFDQNLVKKFIEQEFPKNTE